MHILGAKIDFKNKQLDLTKIIELFSLKLSKFVPQNVTTKKAILHSNSSKLLT